MPAGYSFRPRAWPLALALAACAAGIALGNWQSRRAEEKRALGARLEQVSVQGVFVAGRTVLLDNKTRRGRVGYEVVTPLKLGDSMHVLVNRGWIERERISELRTPAGEVRIEGIALERLPHALELEKNTGGKIRQNLDNAGIEKHAAYALQWYSLAALAVVLFVVLSFRKN